VMMVAEKAADLIAGNEPLAPLDVPFYRHGTGMPLYPPGDYRNNLEHAPDGSPSAAGAAGAAPRGGASA
jgi:choline dehydrogenase